MENVEPSIVWPLLFEPARFQFYDKLMRILQHSQVLVSLLYDSSCIDMIMPARPAVHYSRFYIVFQVVLTLTERASCIRTCAMLRRL